MNTSWSFKAVRTIRGRGRRGSPWLRRRPGRVRLKPFRVRPAARRQGAPTFLQTRTLRREHALMTLTRRLRTACAVAALLATAPAFPFARAEDPKPQAKPEDAKPQAKPEDPKPQPKPEDDPAKLKATIAALQKEVADLSSRSRRSSWKSSARGSAPRRPRTAPRSRPSTSSRSGRATRTAWPSSRTCPTSRSSTSTAASSTTPPSPP